MSTLDFYNLSLKAILKNSRNEILGLQAVNNGSLAGFFDLPGGRITVDEFRTPLTEVLKREINEEVGEVSIKIKPAPVAIGRHLLPLLTTGSKQRNLHVLYLFFEVDYIDGLISISNEHKGYKWLNLATIPIERYFTSGILEGIKMYREMQAPRKAQDRLAA